MVFYISVDLEEVSQTVLSFMDNCSKQKGFWDSINLTLKVI